MKSDAKNKDSIGVLVLRLLIITVCAGLILGVVYTVTAEPIARQQEITANESRKQVLPGADSFVKVDVSGFVAEGSDFGEIEEVYAGMDASGVVTGYTMAIRTKGYSANLMLTVGVDTDNIVQGVDISSHEETPGLGANATAPEFLGQYLGADGPLTVVKTPTGETGEVQALTGATITSRAVTNAVNMAREFYAAVLSEGV